MNGGDINHTFAVYVKTMNSLVDDIPRILYDDSIDERYMLLEIFDAECRA